MGSNNLRWWEETEEMMATREGGRGGDAELPEDERICGKSASERLMALIVPPPGAPPSPPPPPRCCTAAPCTAAPCTSLLLPHEAPKRARGGGGESSRGRAPLHLSHLPRHRYQEITVKQPTGSAPGASCGIQVVSCDQEASRIKHSVLYFSHQRY